MALRTIFTLKVLFIRRLYVDSYKSVESFKCDFHGTNGPSFFLAWLGVGSWH